MQVNVIDFQDPLLSTGNTCKCAKLFTTESCTLTFEETAVKTTGKYTAAMYVYRVQGASSVQVKLGTANTSKTLPASTWTKIVVTNNSCSIKDTLKLVLSGAGIYYITHVCMYAGDEQPYQPSKEELHELTDSNTDAISKVSQKVTELSLKAGEILMTVTDSESGTSTVQLTPSFVNILSRDINLEGNAVFRGLIDGTGETKISGGSIQTESLEAICAKIGGFDITSNCIYSNGLPSLGSADVYLGADGISIKDKFIVTPSRLSLRGDIICSSLAWSGNSKYADGTPTPFDSYIIKQDTFEIGRYWRPTEVEAWAHHNGIGFSTHPIQNTWTKLSGSDGYTSTTKDTATDVWCWGTIGATYAGTANQLHAKTLGVKNYGFALNAIDNVTETAYNNNSYLKSTSSRLVERTTVVCDLAYKSKEWNAHDPYYPHHATVIQSVGSYLDFRGRSHFQDEVLMEKHLTVNSIDSRNSVRGTAYLFDIEGHHTDPEGTHLVLPCGITPIVGEGYRVQYIDTAHSTPITTYVSMPDTGIQIATGRLGLYVCDNRQITKNGASTHTASRDIATNGWTGSLFHYEKDNRQWTYAKKHMDEVLDSDADKIIWEQTIQDSKLTFNLFRPVYASAFTQVSSINFKYDIHSLTTQDCEDKLMSLYPVSYKYKGTTDTVYGFIAEQVKETVPDITREMEDGNLAIENNSIVALLVKQVQNLTRRIEELESSK